MQRLFCRGRSSVCRSEPNLWTPAAKLSGVCGRVADHFVDAKDAIVVFVVLGFYALGHGGFPPLWRSTIRQPEPPQRLAHMPRITEEGMREPQGLHSLWGGYGT